MLPVVPAYLGQLGVVVTSPPMATTTPPFQPRPATTAARPVTPGLLNAIAFVIGFGVVFIALGLSINAATSVLRDHQTLLRQVGGIVLIVLGLNLMGVVRLPVLARTWRPLEAEPSLGRSERRGIAGGLVLGVVFALGWTPCIGPTLGAILTMAAVSAGPQVFLLLIAYCLGLGVPFLLLALATERVPAITRALSRHGRTMELVGGGLVVLMGVAILFDWLAMFSNTFVSLWPQV